MPKARALIKRSRAKPINPPNVVRSDVRPGPRQRFAAMRRVPKTEPFAR